MIICSARKCKTKIGELDRLIFTRSERVGSVLSEALKNKDDIDYIDLRWSSFDIY